MGELGGRKYYYNRGRGEEVAYYNLAEIAIYYAL